MRGSIEKVSKTTNGSDTDADRGEDSGATGTGGPAGPGSAGSAGSAGEAKGPGGEHEDEKAEEWQNTKAARRVSLAKLGLSQNEMRSLSARIKKEEGKEKVEGEGEGEKLELATRKRGEDSGEVMDRKA
ncbi:hypothetical protein EHS25_005113 [Saitozyma podzolica]|uniref:Uncharacterized protein n=1 Tax=Saitozyma podzolica TaxID=1890683 RepID=A0A427Y2E0_9TREE|nr:hypothetical protein EHS25_005113 [Saitozyma podzolica]